MTRKCVLIMAGGTGGHIFPGLALAKELSERGYSVEWLGTEKGLESRLVPEAGISLSLLGIEGVRGKGLKALIKAPFLITNAVLQAVSVIRKIRPRLVVGLGGFVAGPGGVAAKLMGVPLVIHEQNAIAGTTNKLLSKWAKKVFMGFPGAFRQGLVIGNPVRREITAIPAPQERMASSALGEVNVLVIGGSRGARAINELMPEVVMRVDNILRTGTNMVPMRLYHQTGETLWEETLQFYESRGLEVNRDGDTQLPTVVPFMSNMAEMLSWAHLVICRSGALTVSELACAGVASILIPYPHAIDDHQTANAQYLKSNGAAQLWQQKELSAAILAGEVIDLLKSPEKLLQMAKQARALAMPKATQIFADECEQFIG